MHVFKRVTANPHAITYCVPIKRTKSLMDHRLEAGATLFQQAAKPSRTTPACNGGCETSSRTLQKRRYVGGNRRPIAAAKGIRRAGAGSDGSSGAWLASTEAESACSSSPSTSGTSRV